MRAERRPDAAARGAIAEASGGVRRSPGPRPCRPRHRERQRGELGGERRPPTFAITTAPAPAAAAAEAGQRLGERLAQRQRQREHTERGAQRAQVLLQPLAAAEEERLDRRAREPERGADLGVREPVELAQDDRVALLLAAARRAPRQSASISSCRADLALQSRRPSRLVTSVQRLGLAAPQARAALVARDRPEPGRRLARLLPVEQRAVGGEERLLRRVLGLGRVAQDQPADAVDHPPVLLEERGDALSGRPLAPAAGEGRRGARRSTA